MGSVPEQLYQSKTQGELSMLWRLTQTITNFLKRDATEILHKHAAQSFSEILSRHQTLSSNFTLMLTTKNLSHALIHLVSFPSKLSLPFLSPPPHCCHPAGGKWWTFWPCPPAKPDHTWPRVSGFIIYFMEEGTRPGKYGSNFLHQLNL